MLLCKCFAGNQESLNDHAIDLKLNRDIDIRKQSIHSKFTEKAVEFLKSLISDQLANRLRVPSLCLERFTEVFIQDSTRFGLPPSFHHEFKGYGGRSSKAGGKLQFVYGLTTQQMYYQSFESMTINDLTASKNNEWIKEGSLVLRDMGYYNHEGIKQIIDKQAYFISRVKPKTALFDLQGKPFDLTKCISKMKRNKLPYIEKELLIGHNKIFKTRTIICLLPDEIKHKRAKAVAYKAGNRNYTVQKQYHVWAGINVFITNLKGDNTPVKQVLDLYKLRWQVELIFKTWKSYYKIDCYKSMQKYRMQCYLYATLLLVLIHWKIFTWISLKLHSKKNYLSIHKFTKLIIQLKASFTDCILLNKTNLATFLQNLLLLAEVFLNKEKKKHKTGFADIVNEENFVS